MAIVEIIGVVLLVLPWGRRRNRHACDVRTEGLYYMAEFAVREL